MELLVIELILGRSTFLSTGILDLPWPPCSSDMNCIKNCWGLLASAVYEGGHHYYFVDDLKESLNYHWEKSLLRRYNQLLPRFLGVYMRWTGQRGVPRIIESKFYCEY